MPEYSVRGLWHDSDGKLVGVQINGHRRDPCVWFVVPEVAEDIDRLREINADLLEALQLILPMAKGYAAQHPVGSNARYVAHAEEVVRRDPQCTCLPLPEPPDDDCPLHGEIVEDSDDG